MSIVKKAYNRLKSSLKSRLKRLINEAPVLVPEPLSYNSVARHYLKGDGIEIGALHNPLQIPPAARVKYVDRLPNDELRRQYPELDGLNLVEIDIVDDGERLASIEDKSQDFVIAHQFLEHCQNPILAVSNMLRVLKQDGVLYISVPDKRYTFDQHRPITPIEHLLKDYREGPEWSKKGHFREWSAFVMLGHTSQAVSETDPNVDAECDRLLVMDYSIHYHVWTQTEVLELVLTLKNVLDYVFEIELFMKYGNEIMVVLRKQG